MNNYGYIYRKSVLHVVFVMHIGWMHRYQTRSVKILAVHNHFIKRVCMRWVSVPLPNFFVLVALTTLRIPVAFNVEKLYACMPRPHLNNNKTCSQHFVRFCTSQVPDNLTFTVLPVVWAKKKKKTQEKTPLSEEKNTISAKKALFHIIFFLKGYVVYLFTQNITFQHV